MERKIEKNQKGITLISLIITVIIMLILLTITVDVVIDGQILDEAKDSVDKTNNKMEQVEKEAGQLINILEEKM